MRMRGFKLAPFLRQDPEDRKRERRERKTGRRDASPALFEKHSF